MTIEKVWLNRVWPKFEKFLKYDYFKYDQKLKKFSSMTKKSMTIKNGIFGVWLLFPKKNLKKYEKKNNGEGWGRPSGTIFIALALNEI